MVLACASCDDSKRDLQFEAWMLSPRSSPQSRGVTDLDQRIIRIQAYVEHFGYVPQRLEDKLEQQELEQLSSIRARLQGIREEMETLIANHRARVGRL
jgi:hypothetical protein